MMTDAEMQVFCDGLQAGLNKGDHVWRCVRVELFDHQRRIEVLIQLGDKSVSIGVRAGSLISDITWKSSARRVRMNDIGPMTAKIKCHVNIWSAEQMVTA